MMLNKELLFKNDSNTLNPNGNLSLVLKVIDYNWFGHAGVEGEIGLPIYCLKNKPLSSDDYKIIFEKSNQVYNWSASISDIANLDAGGSKTLTVPCYKGANGYNMILFPSQNSEMLASFLKVTKGKLLSQESVSGARLDELNPPKWSDDARYGFAFVFQIAQDEQVELTLEMSA